jgi:hypothetical protein
MWKRKFHNQNSIHSCQKWELKFMKIFFYINQWLSIKNQTLKLYHNMAEKWQHEATCDLPPCNILLSSWICRKSKQVLVRHCQCISEKYHLNWIASRSEFLLVWYSVNMYMWNFMTNVKSFCFMILLNLCSAFYNTEVWIGIKFSK